MLQISSLQVIDDPTELNFHCLACEFFQMDQSVFGVEGDEVILDNHILDGIPGDICVQKNYVGNSKRQWAALTQK